MSLFTSSIPAPARPASVALLRALSLLLAAGVALATLWPLEFNARSGSPLGFVQAGWPRYWTGFDVLSNLLAYVALAAVFCRAWLVGLAPLAALVLTALAAGALSLGLEAAQTYLPSRVPSLLDWLANFVGGLIGAMLGTLWASAARRRARWVYPGADHWLEEGPATGWMLLLIWLAAQAVPQRLTFGTGRIEPVLQRLIDRLQLPGAPDLSLLMDRLWGAARAPTGYGMAVEAGTTICALCGVGVIALALVHDPLRRRLLLGAIVLLAFGLRTLAAQPVYGSATPWVWLSPGAQGGLIVGAVLLYGIAALGARTRAGIGLMVTVIGLVLVNVVPEDPYFESMATGLRAGALANLLGALQVLSMIWPVLAGVWFWRRAAGRRA